MKGYSLTAGNKLYFMQSDNGRKTKTMVVEFIDKFCHVKGNLCEDFIERCKADVTTIQEVQRRLVKCTLEIKKAGEIEYYHIEGDNFIENAPLTDNCVFIL